MKKILVIGGNGSGKSTFSIALAEKTEIPVVHLDKLYWRDNWTSVSRDEFDSLLSEELNKDSWIIDGNYTRTMTERLKYCDTVFYFDFSTIRCLLGVTSRVIKSYGKTRPDMADNCPERFSLEFYKGILSFNKRNRKRTAAALDASDAEVIVFKNRKQAWKYLEDIK